MKPGIKLSTAVAAALAPIAAPVGRLIRTITQPSPSVGRFTLDDGSVVNFNLPVGPAGTPGKSGLLVSGSTLTKGLIYYQYGSGWNLLRPGSHELGLGLISIVDANGDQITPGNLVDVTGLGYVAGKTYYVEDLDANGRNFAVLTLPVPASLTPSAARSYFYLGRVYAVGAKLLLDFKFQAAVADVAASQQVFDPATLTYGATPTAAQVRRIVDVGGNAGGSSTQVYADGDANQDTGFPVSPPKQTIGGTVKGVYLKEQQYTGGKPHSATPGMFTPTQSGNYLLLYSIAENSQGAAGVTFAASATEIWTMRLYAANADYATGQHYTIPADASGTSGSDFLQGHAISAAPGVGSHKLIWVRLSVDGKTVKVKWWNWDTAQPYTLAGIAAQGANEPKTTGPNGDGWELTYTNATAFAVGEVGWLVDNGELRIYRMSKSYDVSVPAPFAVA